jgi:hypothetical protein
VWQFIPQLKINANVEATQLYTSRLKIKHEKYQHLQALKVFRLPMFTSFMIIYRIKPCRLVLNRKGPEGGA